MQKISSLVARIIIISFLLISSFQPKVYAQDAVVSYQSFYDQLSPYGQWINDPEYGNVWVPNEEPGYRPYATRGNWVMTDQGNMWVSDVPWGWACYHYGRWTYNGYYGWVWIPGHEWAPSWVNWRSGGGYYGWAPMGPGQYPGQYYDYPVNYWVFVSPEYLYRPNVYGYYEPRYTERYYNRTTYINETYAINGSRNSYYYGPRAEVIERETHQPVQVYRVSNSNAPGAAVVGGNAVSIYRPAVSAASVNTARPANVIRGTEPVGKPQEFSGTAQRSQPAFRQEMQKQNPAFSAPNNYAHPAPAPRNEAMPQNNQPNNRSEPQGRPVNNQFNHQAPQSTPQTEQHQQPANRPEPQNNEMNRSEPQRNEQQMNRGEQQQQHSEPKANPAPQQSGHNQQPMRQQQQRRSSPPAQKKK